MLLMERDPNPYRALSSMTSYRDRSGLFVKACDERGITYEKKLAF